MCMSLCFQTSNLSFHLFIFHFLRLMKNIYQFNTKFMLLQFKRAKQNRREKKKTLVTLH